MHGLVFDNKCATAREEFRGEMGLTIIPARSKPTKMVKYVTVSVEARIAIVGKVAESAFRSTLAALAKMRATLCAAGTTSEYLR